MGRGRLATLDRAGLHGRTGFVRLALRHGALVVPLVAHGSHDAIIVRVCEPIDWSHLGPDAADDPAIVRHYYEEVLGRMQSNLDELVAQLPHPVITRLTTAMGLDRLRLARGSDPSDSS